MAEESPQAEPRVRSCAGRAHSWVPPAKHLSPTLSRKGRRRAPGSQTVRVRMPGTRPAAGGRDPELCHTPGRAVLQHRPRPGDACPCCGDLPGLVVFRAVPGTQTPSNKRTAVSLGCEERISTLPFTRCCCPLSPMLRVQASVKGVSCHNPGEKVGRLCTSLLSQCPPGGTQRPGAGHQRRVRTSWQPAGRGALPGGRPRQLRAVTPADACHPLTFPLVPGQVLHPLFG